MSPLSPSLRGIKGEAGEEMKHAHKNNYYLYNTRLRKNAHSLRNSMTKAEACLWKYVLRARMMKGYGFRRQRPVLNYIADFMCKELKLIIEVDGITHTLEDVIRKDKIRQEKLERAGFTVIRFTDEEVLKHIRNVQRAIEACVEGLERNIHPLNPPPVGKREDELLPIGTNS